MVIIVILRSSDWTQTSYTKPFSFTKAQQIFNEPLRDSLKICNTTTIIIANIPVLSGILRIPERTGILPTIAVSANVSGLFGFSRRFHRNLLCLDFCMAPIRVEGLFRYVLHARRFKPAVLVHFIPNLPARNVQDAVLAET